ncbi:MAG: SIS domain-containing protein [Bacteroidota bacterium]|nr:SIS domain-containing protein [Bacteroidota bacterium]|tara:strand:- start:165 stop:728 length:564 start_codon:yes stop_codon:yes gene_type:complete
MEFKNLTENFKKNKEVLSSLDLKLIEDLALKIDETRKNQNFIFVAGNGGSSSTASHFVNDLVKATRKKDEVPFIKAISLTDNIPLVSAISNDIDYADIFKFSLESLSSPGDMLIAISASGNSENLIKAVEYSNENDIYTSALLGFDGGRLKEMVNLSNLVNTPIGEYEMVENMHMIICHLISTYLSK